MVTEIEAVGFGQGQKALSGQDKSSVEFVQQNFRRAPSPVYNQSRTFSHESVEEAANSDADSSVHDPSVSASNAITSTVSADDMGQSLFSDPTTAPDSSSSSLDGRGDTLSKPPLHRRSSNKADAHLEVDSSVSGVADADVTSIESGIMGINLPSTSKLENHKKYKNQRDRQQYSQSNVMQEQVYQQQTNTIQVQAAPSQMISQGVSPTYIGVNQFYPGLSNFSTDGFTPPLYATTAAAYMTTPNAFYPNIQPSGYFPPQYSLGGYAITPTALPPFVAAGYLPGSTVPLSFLAGPTNMGILQFPTSGFASPSIPGSPLGGRSEVRFSPNAVRSAGMYPSWQGQAGHMGFDDVKAFSFLEELKSGKGRRFELSDITGHIVEFSSASNPKLPTSAKP